MPQIPHFREPGVVDTDTRGVEPVKGIALVSCRRDTQLKVKFRR
jgi:hypothetical protein